MQKLVALCGGCRWIKTRLLLPARTAAPSFLVVGLAAQSVPLGSGCRSLVGLQLASAVGMALYRREQTGRGQEIQVPMLETMVAFNLVEHQRGTAFDPRSGR